MRITIEKTPAAPAATPAAGSNAVAVAKSEPVKVSAPAVKPRGLKHWKTSLTLGTDLQFGARDRELYFGRLKVAYEQPYARTPQKFFRALTDYAVDYGVTDGVKSANRMDGSVKVEFDVGHRLFVYNLAGAGYDEIRKIDLQYQVGPGAGYHLFTRTNFVANLEAGGNYQFQQRSGSANVENITLRLAEDAAWKITPRVTFAEKFEFFPRVDDPENFRFRFDATLSFVVWGNLSLNLSALDLYDTTPAPGVNQNEVQMRSSLGITF